jgi:hypothetical protein
MVSSCFDDAQTINPPAAERHQNEPNTPRPLFARSVLSHQAIGGAQPASSRFNMERFGSLETIRRNRPAFSDRSPMGQCQK